MNSDTIRIHVTDKQVALHLLNNPKLVRTHKGVAYRRGKKVNVIDKEYYCIKFNYTNGVDDNGIEWHSLYIVFKSHEFYNLTFEGLEGNKSIIDAYQSIESYKMFRRLFEITEEQAKYLKPTTSEFSVFTLEAFQNQIRYLEFNGRDIYKSCSDKNKDDYKEAELSKKLKLKKYLVEIEGIRYIKHEFRQYGGTELKNKLGIESILDLEKIETYEKASKFMQKYISKDIYCPFKPNIPKGVLEPLEERKLKEEFTNYQYWLLQLDKHRNQYLRKVKKYFKILDKIGFNCTLEAFKLVDLAIKESLSVKNKSGAYIRVDKVVKIEQNDTKINPSIPSNNYLNSVVGGGSDSDSVNACSEPKRLCKVTNIDISNQKGVSEFVSLKTCLEIHSKDIELWSRLLVKFVPRKSWHLNLNTLAERMSHNIRNSHHNKFQYVPKAGINQIPLF